MQAQINQLECCSIFNYKKKKHATKSLASQTEKTIKSILSLTSFGSLICSINNTKANGIDLKLHNIGFSGVINARLEASE